MTSNFGLSERGSLNSAKTAVGGALIVTELGRWIVAGNSGTHTVKLVDAATGTDLTGGSVSINTNGATAGLYLYIPLTNPIPLTPSHSYYLMTQETSGGDQWYDQNTSITVTSDLTANNAEYYDTSYHSANVGAYSYGPPNLAYGPSQPAIPGQTLGTLRNNFTGWVGFKFTTASGVPAREMDWTLDPTGNWSAFLTKTSGTTDLNQTRTSSKVNEITAIGGTPTWATPAYDAAGNMTTMPQPGTPTSSFGGIYDAWNRLVQISAGGSTVATYQYDGRNRRIIKYTASIPETRHFYFTNNWQDIEERTGSPPTMERQYVWGIRYIDELVCRDRTGERYYATQDANFSVTSICDTGGTVKERYRYDPYGAITYMNTVWGVIASTAKAWQIDHQGLTRDLEAGLVYNRRRFLHPVLGGFLCRDPIGYAGGWNLYEYLRSSTLQLVDPFGTMAHVCCRTVRGNALDRLFTHCEISDGPCPPDTPSNVWTSYPVATDHSANRSIYGGCSCDKATDADIQNCLLKWANKSIPWPAGAGGAAACGGEWGNNCQTSTLQALSACCLISTWQPDIYAGPRTPCLRGHWERTIRSKNTVENTWVCDVQGIDPIRKSVPVDDPVPPPPNVA